MRRRVNRTRRQRGGAIRSRARRQRGGRGRKRFQQGSHGHSAQHMHALPFRFTAHDQIHYVEEAGGGGIGYSLWQTSGSISEPSSEWDHSMWSGWPPQPQSWSTDTAGSHRHAGPYQGGISPAGRGRMRRGGRVRRQMGGGGLPKPWNGQ